MAKLQVLEYPDERLRLPSVPVREFDEALVRLIDDLFETLYGAGGMALSAPQVNVRQEVLVMDLSANAGAPQTYVNPTILSSSTPGIVQESCLSVPGQTVNVIRATEVRVSARTAAGATFEKALSGMEAVCLQHEMDHFAGKLLVDRMSLFRRLRFRRAARGKSGRKPSALSG